jgi:hypothetical protein
MTNLRPTAASFRSDLHIKNADIRIAIAHKSIDPTTGQLTIVWLFSGLGLPKFARCRPPLRWIPVNAHPPKPLPPGRASEKSCRPSAHIQIPCEQRVRMRVTYIANRESRVSTKVLGR